MSELNELIEWLNGGVLEGHITAEEALKWIAKRAEETAPSRLRPIQPSKSEPGVRLKKDGTPWGKRGAKKQTEMSVVAAGE